MYIKPTHIKPPLRLRQSAVVVLLALLFLGGCNRTVDDTKGDTPSQPDTSSSALILGEAESPFLDSLGKRMTLIPYDGSQILADYDVLVFDGDHHTPGEVHDHEIIKQAVRSKMWVVGLDMTEAHKRQGLGDYLQAASDGNSPAYAVHMGQDANGRPEVRILELPVGERAGRPVSGRLGGTALTDVTVQRGATADSETSGAAFADMLLGHLAKPISAAQADPIPPGLIYTTFYYQQVVPWQAGNAGRKNGSQQAYYQVTYTFTVFLDNSQTSPQGNFQFVLAEANLSANPTSGTGNFLHMNAKDGTDWKRGTYVEMAWFQSYAHIDITPITTQVWTRLRDVPNTVNGETDVTSSVSFNIGYNDGGGSLNFGFSKSVTQRIQDWGVENNTSGVKVAWDYSSEYPIDTSGGDITGVLCAQPIFDHGSCYIAKSPNDLSLEELTLDTKAVWQTPKVVDDWINFKANSEHELMDIYCPDDSTFVCNDVQQPLGPRVKTESAAMSNVFSINLGAVVPIPIKSLTFDPNPVTAPNIVKGTITLDSPAQVDTLITLEAKSDNNNASVPPTVTVKQGQQSATFQVLTNANELSSGEQTTVPITAFYAKDFQAQLTVQAP